MKYFSKKTRSFIALAVIIAGVGGFMLLSGNDPFTSAYVFKRSADNRAEDAFQLIAIKDSDNDGLKDWEEALWKTDPQNPDSDGDGTQDGEEVRADRDPTKPAPNDALPKPTLDAQSDAGSFTNSLVEKTLATYSSIQKTGTADPKLFQKANEEMAQDIRAQLYDPNTRVYELKDIATTDDNSKQRIAEYKNALAKTAATYGDTYENEMNVITKALNTSDENELGNLDAAIQAYRNIIKGFLAITVPSTLAQTHLDFINGYSMIIDADEKMKYILKDPLIGLAGVKEYKLYAEKLVDIVIKLRGTAS